MLLTVKLLWANVVNSVNVDGYIDELNKRGGEKLVLQNQTSHDVL